MVSGKVGVSTNKSTSTSTARPGPTREIKHTIGAARNYYKQVNWMLPFFFNKQKLGDKELPNLFPQARKKTWEKKKKKVSKTKETERGEREKRNKREENLKKTRNLRDSKIFVTWMSRRSALPPDS